ncbi:GMC family oxidoreductase [Paraburkholderia sp. 2C]
MRTAYDYVIVGAGSAGCVLAARLTEDPSVRVALIEAGGTDAVANVPVPIAFPKLFGTAADWGYMSEAEPGLNGRRVYLPAGRMLGGTSSINGMTYIRGNKADFDAWDGVAGWSYADLLPYFIKSESNEIDMPLHGTRGPLSVSNGRSRHPLVQKFIDAAVQAGYSANADFNGAVQDGIGWYQLTQRDGRRCSAATAYLHPAMHRPNLHVMTDARVTRIIFKQRVAIGIEMVHEGEATTLQADREVVLSAGAYKSPQLLMLSGIGSDLASLGIPPVHELPVGENLQDHCRLRLSFLTDERSLLDAGSEADLALFRDEGQGPLTSNLGEGGGFIRTRPGLSAPDIQFTMIPILVKGGSSLGSAHGYSFGPCLAKPTSRGRVSLRDSSPDSAPSIVHHFLTTDEDCECMIAGVRAALDIARQPALRDISSAPQSVPASDSDEDILSYARQLAEPSYHAVGTCAMGRVVDSQLSVLGISRLRVVDASVMPDIVRGNTNAAVIAIAEKAADLMRGEGV